MPPPPAPCRLVLSPCMPSAGLLLAGWGLHTGHIRSGVSVISNNNSNSDNYRYSNIHSIDGLCFLWLSVYTAAALLVLFPLSLTAIPIKQVRKLSLIKVR